jgi:hypothetical protein
MTAQNLMCDALCCTKVICTDLAEDASFETIREFGEERGWQITKTYILCPDHNRGFDR